MRTSVSHLWAAAGIAALVTGMAGTAQAQAPATQLSVGTRFVPNFCIEVGAAGNVAISRCTAEAPQAISYDETTGQILVGGKCVAAPAKGQALTLRTCTKKADEFWTFEANGALKTDSGVCAEIQGSRTESGTPVIAADCTGANSQAFFLTNIRKSATSASAPKPLEPVKGQPVIASYFAQGRCMTAKGAGGVTLETCSNGLAEQSFNFADGSVAPIGTIVQGDTCLTSNAAGAPLTMTSCANTPAQTWTFTAEGALRSESGVCLELARAGELVVTMGAECAATRAQKVYPAVTIKSGTVTLGKSLADVLTSREGVAAVTLFAGYSPYNITASGGTAMSADDQARITGGANDTIVLGGAGILTSRFKNNLSEDGIEAQEGKVSLLPIDWSFFTGETAGTMKLQ